MNKIILFDCDEIIIKNHLPFSKRLEAEFGVPMAKILPFFKNEFLLCETGKADLKQELPKYFKEWGWQGSLENILKFWFEGEAEVSTEFLGIVHKLRLSGKKVYIHTNNEAYRTKYLWENLSLNRHFDGVFSSCELGYLKPAQEFWQEIYNRLGTPERKEILVVDHEVKNVEGAIEAGFAGYVYVNEKELEKWIANNLKI